MMYSTYLRYKWHVVKHALRRETHNYLVVSGLWLILSGYLFYRSNPLAWVGLLGAIVTFILWDVNKGRHIAWERKHYREKS